MKKSELKQIIKEEVSKALNEIGEGVTPFPFSRSGGSSVDKWAEEMASADRSKNISGQWEELPILTYKFKGDKATY
ncbi:MAG: hypothetical protein ACOVOQ_14525, partial [Flavobacterium sp.]